MNIKTPLVEIQWCKDSRLEVWLDNTVRVIAIARIRVGGAEPGNPVIEGAILYCSSKLDDCRLKLTSNSLLQLQPSEKECDKVAKTEDECRGIQVV